MVLAAAWLSSCHPQSSVAAPHGTAVLGEDPKSKHSKQQEEGLPGCAPTVPAPPGLGVWSLQPQGQSGWETRGHQLGDTVCHQI